MLLLDKEKERERDRRKAVSLGACSEFVLKSLFCVCVCFVSKKDNINVRFIEVRKQEEEKE